MSQTSKYESRNPIQIAFIRRFLASVTKAVLSTGKRNARLCSEEADRGTQPLWLHR